MKWGLEGSRKETFERLYDFRTAGFHHERSQRRRGISNLFTNFLVKFHVKTFKFLRQTCWLQRRRAVCWFNRRRVELHPGRTATLSVNGNNKLDVEMVLHVFPVFPVFPVLPTVGTKRTQLSRQQLLRFTQRLHAFWCFVLMFCFDVLPFPSFSLSGEKLALHLVQQQGSNAFN